MKRRPVMLTDDRFQRDLVTALHRESLFSVSGLGIPQADWAAVKPTFAECARAVANIREWRSYLPEDCVRCMIDDGWQWST
jgi:hypothetical protein